MVKTDDYMENNVELNSKEKEMLEDDDTRHTNWLPPTRSKSVGLKYAEYESDESGRIMLDANSTENSKIMPSIDGELDDRRLRRQIANCNERRRMQSINAGFQALRQLLPRNDGDKMSKASILATTAEFIQTLLRERNKLIEENAITTAKRRRLDNGEQNGAPTMDELPRNVLDCIKTIGELRELLQRETQLRLSYEKELFELRNQQISAIQSSPGSNCFSPNSSASPRGGMDTTSRNLLIELASRQPPNDSQQQHSQIQISPPDVNFLSSAIASLSKVSPGAVAMQQQQQQPLLTPIGINTAHHHFNMAPTTNLTALQQGNNNAAYFNAAAAAAEQQSPKTPAALHYNNNNEPVENGNGNLNSASISQRNLQALVLAIRHLEGASAANTANNLLVR